MSIADRIAQIEAERAARRASLEERETAVKLLRRAFEYPRCGDGFPRNTAEKKAERLLTGLYGSIDAACEELDIFG